ncbi:MAG: hypothetical protein ACI92G_000232 [Candidatus Pelagisphaera sp.]|jgi:hypothetical protein
MKNALNDPEILSDFIDSPENIDTLLQLQAELVKMQHWIRDSLANL